jgi:hypothetical protein
VTNLPLAQIEAYKARMGWTVPFVSSHGTTFAEDCGSVGGFMLSVFLRDGQDVYRTYCTTARCMDRLLFVNNILDLAPYGRQEDWEDSPAGWPQNPTYGSARRPGDGPASRTRRRCAWRSARRGRHRADSGWESSGWRCSTTVSDPMLLSRSSQ